ncbi:MAG TPA: hypothetical protein DCR14_15425, partial [Acidimicrobiaceae bacterium]|nr:hypothetical protein [Acidimicrobiaceae bacterium]
LRAAAATEPHPVPLFAPADGPRLLAWAEAQLARGSQLLPLGLPPTWVGPNFEVYGVPTGPASSVSFAVRWHGARPALLWEQQGEPRALSAPVVAPEWRTTEVKGETLWPAPPASGPVTDGGSFS